MPKRKTLKFRKILHFILSENLLLIWSGIWAKFFILNTIQIVLNILFKKAEILDELANNLLVFHEVKASVEILVQMAIYPGEVKDLHTML